MYIQNSCILGLRHKKDNMEHIPNLYYHRASRKAQQTKNRVVVDWSEKLRTRDHFDPAELALFIQLSAVHVYVLYTELRILTYMYLARAAPRGCAWPATTMYRAYPMHVHHMYMCVRKWVLGSISPWFGFDTELERWIYGLVMSLILRPASQETRLEGAQLQIPT